MEKEEGQENFKSALSFEAICVALFLSALLVDIRFWRFETFLDIQFVVDRICIFIPVAFFFL